MKKKKVMSVVLAAIMTVGLLSGCGTSKESDSKEGEQVTLNYWTWFPSTDQIEETVKAFEKENPDIKINMTVMESKAFQEKVPLALSTEEDIDVIGVQPSAFAEEVQDYLANLDELMPEAAGEDWKELYSEKCLEQGNHLTSGDTKMLVLTNSGSMIGYYNAALLKELGCDVPKTIEEYKVAAEKLKEKYPDKYAGVFAGKDAWVMDEMMLTVLGQQGDYYNQWRYDGADVDSKEYKMAFEGFKKFFDEGIFTKDTLDLDYASATEEFTNGNALVYYMGSWESPLLSKQLREKNGIELEDVGAMALPIVEKDGTASVRSYIDSGIGIVVYSEKKEAAANLEAGKKFLEENAKKEGVVTTASGLQYKVITEGKGEAPKSGDTISVKYKGTTTDGKVFDEQKEPVDFPLANMIPGWVEGLQLMKPGAHYEFYIPADLAYGEAGAGDVIKPNSVLVFDVELVEVKHPEKDAADKK